MSAIAGKIHVWKSALAIALLASPATASGAQSRVVSGVVSDASNTPQGGVTIQGRDVKPVTTDDSGRFRLEIPHRKSISLDVRRVGLMPSRFGLREGGDTTVTITVLANMQTLEPVDVRAAATDRTLEAVGFSQRFRERQQGTNSGHFITAKDIEQRNPSRMCPLFETLPGFRQANTQQPGTCFLTGRRLQREQGPPLGADAGLVGCPMTVYLDGQRLNTLNSNYSAVDIDAVILPGLVAGIEYYASANRIPSKYSIVNGSCGLVLIWTKRGG